MAAKQVIFAIPNTNARAKRKQRTFRDNKLINLAKHVMRTIYRFGIESVNYLLDLHKFFFNPWLNIERTPWMWVKY
jgi:hypothetical protein